MDLFDLSGRRALITGSTRGIGLALAGGLGRAGASIVLNGRDGAVLNDAAAQLNAAGIAATGKAFDVTDRASVAAAIDAIEAEQGPIDILVNNAGMQHRTPLEDFPEEVWHRLMRTN